jgi:hypothetical protein
VADDGVWELVKMALESLVGSMELWIKEALLKGLYAVIVCECLLLSYGFSIVS